LRGSGDHRQQAKESSYPFIVNALKIIAIITARGNSKRISGKNILELDGHPLISWSIASAVKSDLIENVFVSTDSNEIKEISKKYNCGVLDRPDSISGDHATTDEVLEYILCNQLKKYNPTHFVVIQPTSPLREEGFLDESIRIFLNTENYNKGIEVIKFNANFARIKNDELLFSDIKRTQDLEDFFYPSGRFFIYDLDSIFKKDASIKILPISGPHYQENINVDDYEDLKIMKMIYEAKKSDFLYLKEYLDNMRSSL
jgi:CMP-N-acetylneuraminic acid synthetase